MHDRSSTDLTIDHNLPLMRAPLHGDDANQRLPVHLRLQAMWPAVEAKGRPLLRLLLLWRCGVSAHPRGTGMLRRTGIMNSRDWAADRTTLAAIWGLPSFVMLLALLLAPGPRAAIWIAMLTCMGGACLANARRCGRTHCRYTGPFFLSMAVAVSAYIIGLLPLGSWPWLALGLTIAVGNAFLWWGTERALGTYRPNRPAAIRDDPVAGS